MEEVKKLMPLLKFNNEQCEYLADKLKVVVVTAASLLSELRTHKPHGPCSSADIAKLVDIFDFLVGLSNRLRSLLEVVATIVDPGCDDIDKCGPVCFVA